MQPIEEIDFDHSADLEEGQRMVTLFDEHEEAKARNGGSCLTHGSDCDGEGTEDF